MTVATLATTGVTGELGRLVATLVAASGAPQRMLVRAASTAKAPRLAGAEIAISSYEDRAAAVHALQGIELLFMVSASESAERLAQHRTFIDAAAEAGVRHVLYTSFLGAAPDSTFTLARDHWVTEEHLRASGMRTTFLRDSFYLDLMPLLAGPDGVIRGPAGDGVAALVARADVARVAGAILASPGQHVGKTYDLTGREALSLADVARILTEVGPKPMAYHPETVEEARASRAHHGAPAWQVDAWVSTYTAIAAGDFAVVNDNVQRLTGRPATTLRELLS